MYCFGCFALLKWWTPISPSDAHVAGGDFTRGNGTGWRLDLWWITEFGIVAGWSLEMCRWVPIKFVALNQFSKSKFQGASFIQFVNSTQLLCLDLDSITGVAQSQVASPSMVQSFRMKISSWNTPVLESCPWPMLDPTRSFADSVYGSGSGLLLRMIKMEIEIIWNYRIEFTADSYLEYTSNKIKARVGFIWFLRLRKCPFLMAFEPNDSSWMHSNGNKSTLKW